MRALTPRQNRALAIALLAGSVLALGAMVAVPTWLLHARYDRAIEDFSDRLARYRRVAALRPQIEDSIKAVEAHAGRQYYLKSASPGSAAAELQGLVTRIAEANKGRIMSSQALPAKEDGKGGEPVKAATTMQLNASITSLLAILHAIETHHPYLFVEQLTVRAGQGRGYRPAPGVEPDYVVQITVAGYGPPAGGKP